MANTNTTPEDAKIVTKNSPPTATPPENTAAFDINAYNATLEIVRRRLTVLEKAHAEMKKLNEMYNDTFVSDGFYVDADKVVKDALKRKKDVKSQLAKQPQAAQLNGKIKDLEVAVNIVSGTGKEHMALLAAILKLGVGVRLVALENNEFLDL